GHGRGVAAEGHVLGVDGAGGVIVAADATDPAGDEMGVARILALHEDRVAAEDRRGAVAFGDLAVLEVDLGVDPQAADDARDRVPGHFDELARLGGGLALGCGDGGHDVAPCAASALARIVRAARSAAGRRSPARRWWAGSRWSV